jgi:hypothetical protein
MRIVACNEPTTESRQNLKEGGQKMSPWRAGKDGRQGHHPLPKETVAMWSRLATSPLKNIANIAEYDIVLHKSLLNFVF